MVMRKMLIVLFGVLAFQSYVFAETWEDRAANKTPWSAEFPDDPACWNPPVGWNAENPWVVGKGDHSAYDGLSECFRVCADNNTCYRDGWQDTDAGSATCRARGVPQGTGAVSTYVWWWAKTALNEITFQGAGGLTAGKLYIVAWCE